MLWQLDRVVYPAQSSPVPLPEEGFSGGLGVQERLFEAEPAEHLGGTLLGEGGDDSRGLRRKVTHQSSCQPTACFQVQGPTPAVNSSLAGGMPDSPALHSSRLGLHLHQGR